MYPADSGVGLSSHALRSLSVDEGVGAAVPMQSVEVASRLFEGEAIIVSSRTYRVCLLNGTGSSIWGSIDGRRSVAEIARKLCRSYDISEGEALSATRRFLDQLVTSGLAQWSTDSCAMPEQSPGDGVG